MLTIFMDCLSAMTAPIILCTLQPQRKIHILEFGYTSDVSFDFTLDRERLLHPKLCLALSDAGESPPLDFFSLVLPPPCCLAECSDFSVLLLLKPRRLAFVIISALADCDAKKITRIFVVRK